MKIEIFGRPEFVVPLNVELIEALILCATLHYDGVCQSMAKQGPLHRAINVMKGLEIDMYSTTMTWRELDTLMKVCEFPPRLNMSAQQRVLIDEFSKVGGAALREGGRASAEWKAEVQ